VVHSALVDASVHAFRIGMGVGAALSILGGLVALIGIENPKRRVRSADRPGGALTGVGAAAADGATTKPLPAGAAAHV